VCSFYQSKTIANRCRLFKVVSIYKRISSSSIQPLPKMKHVFGDMPECREMMALCPLGKDLSVVFHMYPRDSDRALVASAFFNDFLEDSSSLQKLVSVLRRGVARTRDEAYIGYVALSVLNAHPAAASYDSSMPGARELFRVFEELGIENREMLSHKLKDFGACFSKLVLAGAAGLTRVEIAVIGKLEKYYAKHRLPVFTRKAELSAGLLLDQAEEIALLGLFAQTKRSAMLMRDYFVVSDDKDYFFTDQDVYNRVFGEGVVFRSVAEDAMTVRNTQLRIYTTVLDGLLTRDLSEPDRSRIQEEKTAVSRELQQPVIMADTGSKSATKASLAEVLDKKGNIAFTRQRLTTLLGTLSSESVRGIDSKGYLQSVTESAINSGVWARKCFRVGDLSSEIIPTNISAARKMHSEAIHIHVRNTVMDARGNGGLGCQSNLGFTTTAANNQLTELVDQANTLLFAGIRHAIVATRGVGDVAANRAANKAKAIDLLRSALMQKIHHNKVTPGSPIHVDLVSISLVTPDSVRAVWYRYHEKQMLAEQVAALSLLPTLPDDEMQALLAEFIDGSGQPFFGADQTLSISVTPLNFGVNEFEIAGRANQRPLNLAGMRAFLDRVSNQCVEANTNSLKHKLYLKLRTLFVAYQRVITLQSMQQQSNPYVLPVLIAALAHQTGFSVLFNCKSGKDRTGLMDVMIKIFMRQLSPNMGSDDRALNYFERLESAYRLQKSGVVSDETQWLASEQIANREMLFNSGNREVQEENTTAWGYKLVGENTARLFAVVFGIRNMGDVYGFSKLIDA
jgi:hypothetical protein